ncbi:hypothetical protein INR49_013486, partial [Caranx melampygus]
VGLGSKEGISTVSVPSAITSTVQIKSRPYLLLRCVALPVFFIDLVSKAHSVDNSEFEAHVTLLEFISVGFECDTRLVVLGGLPLKLGVEQCVHQSGLTQTRLTWTEKMRHESQVTSAPLTEVEEYPEIENFFPYDPLEFEKYNIPEDFVAVSACALPGLGCFTPAPRLCEDIPNRIDPLPDLSPVKIPKRSDYCSELDSFLQTLDELTIELPPEIDC